MSISPLNDPPMTICPVSSHDELESMTESRYALKRLDCLNEMHHSNNQYILCLPQNYQQDMDQELPSFGQFIYKNLNRAAIQGFHDSLAKCHCCKRHCGDEAAPGYVWVTRNDCDLGARCPCNCRHYRRQLREVIDFIDSS